MKAKAFPSNTSVRDIYSLLCTYSATSSRKQQKSVCSDFGTHVAVFYGVGLTVSLDVCRDKANPREAQLLESVDKIFNRDHSTE